MAKTVWEVLTPKKSADTGEWVVKVKKNGKLYEKGFYYSDDKEDAMATMKDMKKRYGLAVESYQYESLLQQLESLQSGDGMLTERRKKKNILTGRDLTQNLVFQLNGRTAGVAKNLEGIVGFIDEIRASSELPNDLEAALNRVQTQLRTVVGEFGGVSGIRPMVGKAVDIVRNW